MPDGSELDQFQEQALLFEALKMRQLAQLDSILPTPKKKSTYSYAELEEKKDEEQKFIIPDLIPQGVVAIFIGEDGIGKTQLMTQLCLHIAFKMESFLGLELNAIHHSALIVATEEASKKWIKAAVKQSYTIEPNHNPKDVNIDFMEASDFDDFLGLTDEIKSKLLEKQYDLMVVDAMSDLFSLIEGEINSNSHARRLLSFFQGICNHYNTTIIIIHHAAKSKMVVKRKEGKLFVEKDDSQGAGAITQKARTVLALTNDPKTIAVDGLSYTNYLHVVKANLMGKQYLKNAIICEFNARSLLHKSKGLVDIELFNTGDNGPEAVVVETLTATPRKANPREIPIEQHHEILGQIFKEGIQLTRIELIAKMKIFYGVGGNKIESKDGFIAFVLDQKIVDKTNYGFRYNKPVIPSPYVQPGMNFNKKPGEEFDEGVDEVAPF